MNPEPRHGEEQPTVIQNVYAYYGFAYGVVNADVHVFGNGRPVYTLAEHRPPTGEPNPRWPRQPSRLLDASYGVVPFTGREAELRDLAEWRDQKRDGEYEPLAVRWLHGPGGRGKTRLANQFAALSAEVGWKTIEVHRGGQITPESQGSHDASVNKHIGLLVLVDYADRWPLQEMTWLFANQLFAQRIPVRVLLVARTAQAWPAVRSALVRRADASTRSLDAVSNEPGSREPVFEAARSRFTDIYGLADTGTIATPRNLGDDDFGLTLTLHMSALVAVDAHVNGRRIPSDAAGLSAYLLDRERENWTWLHETRQRFRTAPEAMAKVVYTAALTGAVSHTDGVEAIGSLEIPCPPQDLLVDHKFCYPPSEPEMVLEPLYPDRLAEDFVALLTPGHDNTDHVTDPWTTDAPAALLSNTGRTPTWTPHSVTVLATAAGRWPHLARRVLYPLLRNKPDLALAGGNAALTALAFGASNPLDEQIGPDHLAVLEAIEPLIPRSRLPDLEAGALAIVERLTAFRLTTATDPAERAPLLNHLGLRRMDAGHRYGAVETFTEVVALERELADRDRETRALSGSLNNLCLALRDVGRWEQALDAIREATALLRERYENDPAAYRESLASSLYNHSWTLSTRRRWDEALDLGEEAIDLFSAGNDSWNEQYFLAKCLVSRSAQLAGAGRNDEALAVCVRAVAMKRELFENDPEGMRFDLSVTLIEFGIRLSDTDHKSDALAVFEEAAPLYHGDTLREVSQMLLNFGSELNMQQRYEDSAILSDWAALLDDKDGDQENRAVALVNLGAGLYGSGRAVEAVDSLEEAAAIFHRLGKVELESWALISLGGALLSAGRVEDSVTASERAVVLQQAHSSRVEGRALFNLGSALLSVGRVEEAIDAIRDAALIYQATGGGEMEADAQSKLGDGLTRVGRPGEAVPAYERAADIYSDHNRGKEGSVLANLGVALIELKRFDEAIIACRRAESIFRAKGDREGMLRAQNNRGAALVAAERSEEAVTVCSRVAAIGREIGDRRGEAMASRNLGHAFRQLRRQGESIMAYGHAATLFRAIGDLDSESGMQQVIGFACLSAQRYEDAVAAYQRKLAIVQDPVDRSDLAQTLTGLTTALTFGNRYEEAIVSGNQAAAICQELGAHADEGIALDRVVVSLIDLGRSDEALAVGRRAIAAYHRAGDLPREAAAQRQVGRILGRAGRFEEAAPICARAAALFRELGDLESEDQMLRNQLTALYSAGEQFLKEERFEEAVVANQEAAELDRARFGNPFTEGSALLNLCTGLMALGRYTETIAAAQRAVILFRKLPDRPVVYEGRALRRLGDALLKVERARGAADAFQQAAAVFEATGDLSDECYLLSDLYTTLVQLRDEEALPVARRYFQVARAVRSRWQEGIARVALGAMLVDLDHLDEGIAFNLESAAFFQQDGDHEGEQLVLSFVQRGRGKQRRVR